MSGGRRTDTWASLLTSAHTMGQTAHTMSEKADVTTTISSRQSMHVVKASNWSITIPQYDHSVVANYHHIIPPYRSGRPNSRTNDLSTLDATFADSGAVSCFTVSNRSFPAVKGSPCHALDGSGGFRWQEEASTSPQNTHHRRRCQAVAAG